MPLSETQKRIIDEMILNESARLVATTKPKLRVYVCSFIKTANRNFDVPHADLLELLKQEYICVEGTAKDSFCSEFWMLTAKARNEFYTGKP